MTSKKNLGGNKNPMIVDGHKRIIYYNNYSNKNTKNQNILGLWNKKCHWQQKGPH